MYDEKHKYIPIHYNKTTFFTNFAQLNTYKWAIETGLYDYINDHKDELEDILTVDGILQDDNDVFDSEIKYSNSSCELIRDLDNAIRDDTNDDMDNDMDNDTYNDIDNDTYNEIDDLIVVGKGIKVD